MADKPFLEQPELHTKAPFRAALLSYPSNLQEALRQAQADVSKTLFGVGHGIASVAVTKIIAASQPDFVWIDLEHGSWTRETVADAIHAVHFHSEGKSMAIVRVPKHDEVCLTAALDAGADGIIVPHCESVEEVQVMAKRMYYPPLGTRSFSPWTFTQGITDTSLYPSDSLNVKTANTHTALIAQVESLAGLEAVDAIAALDPVAALMLGPTDFCLDAGAMPMFDAETGAPHPVLGEAIGRFAAAGGKSGKPLLGGVLSLDQAPMMLGLGFRALTVNMDVWAIARMTKEGVTQAREIAGAFAAGAGAGVVEHPK